MERGREGFWETLAMNRIPYALPVVVIALGMALPVAAQDAGTPPATNSAPSNRPVPQKILILPTRDTGGATLKTDRSGYQPGQPVRFTFTISNSTKKVVNYDFPNSQQFDITVTDGSGDAVWDSAQGKVFAQSLTHLGLKSNQKKTFTAVWNGRDMHGQPVAPGLYNAHARMTSNDHPAVTGGFIVDTDTDPNNMGVPTRSPAENGAVREVSVNPPLTASNTVAIGVRSRK